MIKVVLFSFFIILTVTSCSKQVDKKAKKEVVAIDKKAKKEVVAIGKKVKKEVAAIGKKTKKEIVAIGKKAKKEVVAIGKKTKKKAVAIGKETKKKAVAIGKETKKKAVAIGKKTKKEIVAILYKIKAEKIKLISGLTKEAHYNRNVYQPVSSLPKTLNKLLDRENWKKLWFSDGKIATHNLAGAKNNVSYRGLGKNSGIQVIYDNNGALVTTNENLGTWDFGVIYNSDASIRPTGLEEHFRKDVMPWIIWGNNQFDTTTRSERLGAVLSSAKESGHKKLLGLFKSIQYQ